MPEAESLAAARGEFIVVDFWHPACGPCRRFHRDMQENQQLIAGLGRTVLLSLNVLETEAERLAEDHGVHQFPTYAVMNTKGEVIDTWIGYFGAESWTARLDQILADPLTVAERKGRFEAEPTPRDAVLLGEVLYTQQRCREAYEYIRWAQSADPRAAKETEVPIFLFRCAYEGVKTGEFSVSECATVSQG
jgi:thioredoxin-like negative regulator of GroEL